MSSAENESGTTGDAQLDAAIAGVRALKDLGARKVQLTVGAVALEVSLVHEDDAPKPVDPLPARQRKELEYLRQKMRRLEEIPGFRVVG